jgi:hypothetical protein
MAIEQNLRISCLAGDLLFSSTTAVSTVQSLSKA